jgi:two-component system, sensor histidine kinase and response regulator
MDDSPLQVLLIEDNPTDVLLLQEALAYATSMAFVVTSVARLGEGLTRLRERSFDVVLLDLSLPDSQGLETCITIARQASGVPIVVLTALADETLAVRALREGAQDYLIKGQVEGPMLARAIRYAMERQRAEAEIHALNAALEQRVRERTAELAVANRELEAFAHSVAHDLRAPLRGIDGFSHLLVEDYADRLDEAGQDYLRRIRAGVQRMSALIDALLTLAGVTRMELVRSRVSLSMLAHAIAEELQQGASPRQVEFCIASGVIADGDARLLRVVLNNLLGNAWKFTAHHPRARIEFGVLTPPKAPWVFFVRDDGAGFDIAYADKLFTPFQRLHRATEFPGTGIGLATVQRIIHRHGGRIWAEAAVEQGATFYFTLTAPRRHDNGETVHRVEAPP